MRAQNPHQLGLARLQTGKGQRARESYLGAPALAMRVQNPHQVGLARFLARQGQRARARQARDGVLMLQCRRQH